MGTWIDEVEYESLSRLVQTLSISNDAISGYHSDKVPFRISCMHWNQSFQINLINIRNRSQLPPRQHAPGTLLLYKQLAGESLITASNSIRVLQEDYLKADLKGTDPEYLRRIGGPCRVIQSVNHSSSHLLEICVYPPGYESEKLPSSLSDNCLANQESAHSFVNDTLSYEQASTLLIEKPKVNELISAEVFSYDDIGLLNLTFNRNIGGLSSEISTLLRRVLLSRSLSPSLLTALGISPVKGVLLYGKPGSGKVRISRTLMRLIALMR